MKSTQPRYCRACAEQLGVEYIPRTTEDDAMLVCAHCNQYMVPSEEEILAMFRDVWTKTERTKIRTNQFFAWVCAVSALIFVGMGIWFLVSPDYNTTQAIIATVGAVVFAMMGGSYRRSAAINKRILELGPPL